MLFVQQPFRCDQLPSHVNMETQIFITNTIQLNTHPTAHTYIRRLEESLWCSLDQFCLDARWSGDPYSHMTVIVMVVSEHDKYLFMDEECRLAM